MRKAGLPASVSYLTQEPASAEASSSSETSKIADRNNFHERNTPEPLSVPSMFSIPDGSQAADCAPELQQVPAGFAVISTRGDIGGKGLPRATSCGEDIRTGELNLWPKKKKPAEAGFFGAVEKTRTSTGCPTATSTLRVYQFRHDRIVVGRFASARQHVAKASDGHKRDMTVFFKSLPEVWITTCGALKLQRKRAGNRPFLGSCQCIARHASVRLAPLSAPFWREPFGPIMLWQSGSGLMLAVAVLSTFAGLAIAAGAKPSLSFV